MKNRTLGYHWLIEGFDGTENIFLKRVDINQLSINQAESLLRALVAKASLTLDEIVGGYVKRRTKGATAHLLVQRDGPFPIFHCGSNPHFIISLRNASGAVCRNNKTPK